MSSLSFISNLIEKVVAKQLNDFISQEGIHSVHQSVHSSFHSTNIALPNIQNGISTSVDSGKAIVLILLDLFTAFDMINITPFYMIT